LPVCRWWEAAVQAITVESLLRFSDTLRALHGYLQWRQNANYTVTRLGERFRHNYGYAEIIGLNGLMVSDRVAVGVLLLGPDTEYPPHAHPATEHYCVLSGSAHWGLGGCPPTVRDPGSLIYHPSGVAHDMRTGENPLLALYLWQGNLSTPANLVTPTRR
jgi:mannose-6-phosphate isomerase-like protein (cupin superfamily)